MADETNPDLWGLGRMDNVIGRPKGGPHHPTPAGGSSRRDARVGPRIASLMRSMNYSGDF